MAARLAAARASLDLDPGGGEGLDGAERIPPAAAATESWPPNLARATRRLRPRGVVVVAVPEGGPLPFADGAFDLVTSRHPVANDWPEVARVLEPGGIYFSQQVGPASVVEIIEYFLGPQPDAASWRDPQDARAGAEAAGLEVIDLRLERLHTEFRDVGAVVYFLRKVIWMVPGFTVAQYLPRLRELHEQIQEEGPFQATTTRFLIEARKRPAAAA